MTDQNPQTVTLSGGRRSVELPVLEGTIDRFVAEVLPLV